MAPSGSPLLSQLRQARSATLSLPCPLERKATYWSHLSLLSLSMPISDHSEVTQSLSLCEGPQIPQSKYSVRLFLLLYPTPACGETEASPPFSRLSSKFSPVKCLWSPLLTGSWLRLQKRMSAHIIPGFPSNSPPHPFQGIISRQTR